MTITKQEHTPEHTPGPWKVDDQGSCLRGVNIESTEDCVVFVECSQCTGDDERLTRVNAEFIVRACNNFDAMLTALKALTTPRYAGDVCPWCGSGGFETAFEHHGLGCPLLPALDLIAQAEKGG